MPLDLRLVFDDAPVADTPLKVKCPNHKDTKTPNLAVYSEHIYCFVCGYTRRNEDALAVLLKRDEVDTELLHKYSSESVADYRERASIDARACPLPAQHAVLYHTLLNTTFRSRKQWLYDRGLTDDTITEHMLGHDGERFVIPIYSRDKTLLSLRYRADAELCSADYLRKHRYLGLLGRNGQFLYPEWRTLDTTVYICEGEFDAMILWQMGLPAVTITNGAGQLKKVPALLPASVTTVYICADSDDAGRAAAAETAKLCTRFDTYIMEVPWGKDITEAYCLNNNIQWRCTYAHNRS